MWSTTKPKSEADWKFTSWWIEEARDVNREHRTAEKTNIFARGVSLGRARLEKYHSIDWSRVKMIHKKELWYKTQFKEAAYITTNKNILSETSVQVRNLYLQNNLLFLNSNNHRTVITNTFHLRRLKIHRIQDYQVCHFQTHIGINTRDYVRSRRSPFFVLSINFVFSLCSSSTL